MTRLPIQLYGFGVVDRWRSVAKKALEEGILQSLGKVSAHIEDEGIRYRVNVLGASGSNWYEVEIFRNAEQLLVGCECRAGQSAKPCKHIAAVMINQGWLARPAGVVELPRKVDMFPDDGEISMIEFVKKATIA